MSLVLWDQTYIGRYVYYYYYFLHIKVLHKTATVRIGTRKEQNLTVAKIKTKN